MHYYVRRKANAVVRLAVSPTDRAVAVPVLVQQLHLAGFGIRTLLLRLQSGHVVQTHHHGGGASITFCGGCCGLLGRLLEQTLPFVAKKEIVGRERGENGVAAGLLLLGLAAGVTVLGG